MISNSSNAVRAQQLDVLGDEERALAKQDVHEAGDHAGAALANTAAAGVNLVTAAGKVVKGAAQAVRSVGRLGAAAGLTVVAAATGAVESAFTGPRIIGGPHDKQPCSATGQQAQQPPPAPSDRLMNAARKLVGESATDMRHATGSWGDAVKKVANGVANVAIGAGHTAGVAGNLVQAGARSQWAARLELAEWDARFAAWLDDDPCR